MTTRPTPPLKSQPQIWDTGADGEQAAALAKLPVKTVYIDGELCGVRPDGVTSFALMQAATDSGGTADLVYYAFDLLQIDGKPIAYLPLGERKAGLAEILVDPPEGIVYSEHKACDGESFRKAAYRHGLEGIVSKRNDRPYTPGNRGIWVKSKCLNRAEFVIVGWTDPEGARPFLGAPPERYLDTLLEMSCLRQKIMWGPS